MVQCTFCGIEAANNYKIPRCSKTLTNCPGWVKLQEDHSRVLNLESLEVYGCSRSKLAPEQERALTKSNYFCKCGEKSRWISSCPGGTRQSTCQIDGSTCPKELARLEILEVLAQEKFQRHFTELSGPKKRTCNYFVKYGVSHPYKDPVKKELMLDSYHKTSLANHGTEHPTQNKEFRKSYKKPASVWIGRRLKGLKHHWSTELGQTKNKESMLEKYGAENPGRVKKFMLKREVTCLAKYGVRNVMQDVEIQSKSLYKSYQFTLPSGFVLTLQGYEDRVILELLELGWLESEIVAHPSFSINYLNPITNRACEYFPDIFLPKENRIIEVKSSWTYDGKGTNPDLLSINLAKRQACLDAGYSFNFVIR